MEDAFLRECDTPEGGGTAEGCIGETAGRPEGGSSKVSDAAKL